METATAESPFLFLESKNARIRFCSSARAPCGHSGTVARGMIEVQGLTKQYDRLTAVRISASACALTRSWIWSAPMVQARPQPFAAKGLIALVYAEIATQ